MPVIYSVNYKRALILSVIYISCRFLKPKIIDSNFFLSISYVRYFKISLLIDITDYGNADTTL